MSTLNELLEVLQEMAEEYGDAEVRLATQPNWALQYAIDGVALNKDISGEEKCEKHDFYSCDDCADDMTPIVYLTEGSRPPNGEDPYCSRRLWDVARRLAS